MGGIGGKGKGRKGFLYNSHAWFVFFSFPFFFYYGRVRYKNVSAVVVCYKLESFLITKTNLPEEEKTEEENERKKRSKRKRLKP